MISCKRKSNAKFQNKSIYENLILVFSCSNIQENLILTELKSGNDNIKVVFDIFKAVLKLDSLIYRSK